MRVITIFVHGRDHTFVDLDDVNLFPRHFFPREGSEHEPRRRSAANGEDEVAVGDDQFPCCGCDDCGPAFGDRGGIGKDFDLHGETPADQD